VPNIVQFRLYLTKLLHWFTV